MNVQQLKFALAVMKTGSITKAAESLYVSQPNLSNSLKDLESEIGITLFRRTRAGVETTSEGIRFILQAQTVIEQFEDLEYLYTKQRKEQVTLRFVSTRFSPGAQSLIDFINIQKAGTPMNIQYRETSHFNVIDALARGEADVGRIFFEGGQLHYFKNLANQHQLEMELMWEDKATLLMSKASPLAAAEKITTEMLTEYIVVRYSELENSDWSYAHMENQMNLSTVGRSINVSDRGTLMEILSACPQCYFWILGTTPDIMRRYDLVQRSCEDADIQLTEALLYPKRKVQSEETMAAIQCIRSGSQQKL